MNEPEILPRIIIFTEQELVAFLKAKDESSFSYLYDNYSGALYGIVLNIIPEKEIANDVLQEVFIKIWHKIDSYDDTKGRLFTWMFNITHNLSIDMVRSKTYKNNNRNQEMPGDEYFESPGIVIQMNVDNIGVKKVVHKLKPGLKVLIDLAYFKGYSHQQIAAMEKLPLGTVKTRIRAALLQLKTGLK